METAVVRAGDRDALARAQAVLRVGGLVAFPTDTVYGLAALPTDLEAVGRLYAAKERGADQPIPLLLSDVDRLAEVAVLPEVARPLVRRFWPGELTLVLPKTEAVRAEVSAGPTVGVRLPDLDLAQDLIRAAGGVLAVTSANRSGEPAALTAEDVLEQLGGRIELVVDGGRCRGGIPSTVLDCTTWPPIVLRHGDIAESDIQETLRGMGAA
jgi:L-threonylcarbamoyladenylate synthase